MDSGTLLVPLAPDCEAMRQGLIANPLPPVWELDAATARRLHREGTLAARVNWQPDLDALPVSSVDTPASDGLPARRTYRPDGADDDTPCLVWLHGGGWVLGDLDTADATARTASAATGWTVVSVDYRCAPVARFPDAVDDAVAAADAALREHRRVVVGGDSAGATLAAVVAQQRGSHPGLVGQVLVYPATDPRLRSPSAHQFVDGPLLTRHDMEWFYDQYLADDADRESPLADLVAGLVTEIARAPWPISSPASSPSPVCSRPPSSSRSATIRCVTRASPMPGTWPTAAATCDGSMRPNCTTERSPTRATCRARRCVSARSGPPRGRSSPDLWTWSHVSVCMARVVVPSVGSGAYWTLRPACPP